MTAKIVCSVGRTQRKAGVQVLQLGNFSICCLILLQLAMGVDIMYQSPWLLTNQNETNTISEVVDDLK